MNESNLHDLSMERALLCSLMIDRALFAEFRHRIDGVFYQTAHAVIWGWMVETNTNDPQIILSRYPHYTDQILDITSTAAYANVCGIVDVLADLMFRRHLFAATEVLAAASTNREIAPMEAIKDFRESIRSITRSRILGEPEHVRDILPRVLTELELKMTGHGDVGVLTGIADIDAKLGPMEPGDLVLLAARPSMGKSALALQIVASAALAGKRVLVFSLEMTKTLCVSRMICSRSGVPISAFNMGTATKDNLTKIAEECGAIADMGIYIDDSPGIMIDEIVDRSTEHKRNHGLDLLVVDHAQLVGSKHGRSRNEEMAEISKEMKNIARALNIPNVCLSQLSRACESRNPPRPMLSDLRDSGAWEQDADKVVFLFRPAYYNKKTPDDKKNICEVIVGKNRNGPTGYLEMQFDAATMIFRNLYIGESEGEPEGW